MLATTKPRLPSELETLVMNRCDCHPGGFILKELQEELPPRDRKALKAVVRMLVAADAIICWREPHRATRYAFSNYPLTAPLE